MNMCSFIKEYTRTQLKAYLSIGLILSFLLATLFTPGSAYAASLVKMKSVSGGNQHSAAVGVDGSVWTWGDNYFGQLGDGSKTSRSIPGKLKGLTNFKAVACGANHTLALKADGTVWAWGHNMCKQVGNGTKSYTQNIPVKVNGLTNVQALACGLNHSAALTNDGKVWTWGRNTEGQLGRTIPTQNSDTPGVIENLDGIIAIAAMTDYTAALKNDGTVWICGQVNLVPVMNMVQIEGLGDIIAISASGDNIVALNKEGTVSLWKNTYDGSVLRKLKDFTDIVAISSSQSQIIAKKKDGSLWAGGKANAYYGFIYPMDLGFDNPVKVYGVDDVMQIASGYNHTLIIKKDGTVWTIGNNMSGQLGNGINIFRNIPVKIPGLPAIKAVDACSYQSIALGSSGKVFLWGENKYSTDRNFISSPIIGCNLDNIKEIACTNMNSAALLNDGTVWCWGTNVGKFPMMIVGLKNIVSIKGSDNSFVSYAALEDDGTVWEWSFLGSKDIPVKVDGISNVVAISKGSVHTLALKNDGTVWSWSGMWTGETSDAQAKPMQVKGLTGVISISAGDKTSIALKKDGTVWTWNTDKYGYLDSGTTKSKAPVKIQGLSGVTAIAGTSTALKKDGTVWSWGANQYGQLGDGTLINRPLPVKVFGLKDVIKIASSLNHSLAVDKKGMVWSWGLNNNGQLGDGVHLFEEQLVKCFPN